MHKEKAALVSKLVCNRPDSIQVDKCFESMGSESMACSEYHSCCILEKSEEQLDYILSPLNVNTFLSACPGSGKTESLAIKAAYEISRWKSRFSGIALLTFTNTAADVINARVIQYRGINKTQYPHFIGTFDSWVHGFIVNPFGYHYTEYSGRNNDRSIRLVDSNLQGGFLTNYLLHYFDKGRQIPVHINQVVVDLRSKIYSECTKYARKKLWEPKGEQLISDQIIACKKKEFWKNGFCTYHDVEIISYFLLKYHPLIGEMLVKKFPVIIVDEAQDLSYLQVCLLRKLIECGAKVHIIGDLRQAIYGFKYAEPANIEEYVRDLKVTEMSLTLNYRSYAQINQLCTRIVCDNTMTNSTLHDSKKRIFCKKYTDLSVLPAWFTEFVSKSGLDKSRCAIVARGHSTVGKIQSISKTSDYGDLLGLARAIELWLKKRHLLEDILEKCGKFITSYYFKGSYLDRSNFYQPEQIESAIFWRLYLYKFINAVAAAPELIDMNVSCEEWCKYVREKISDALKSVSVPRTHSSRKIVQVINNDILGASPTFRCPPGKAKIIMASLIAESSSQKNGLRVTTIHSVKGETLDAVMLVSAPDRRGGDGHWRDWICDSDSEAARLAYVASSRPIHYLVWAIPDKRDDDLGQLTNLGFEFIE